MELIYCYDIDTKELVANATAHARKHTYQLTVGDVLFVRSEDEYKYECWKVVGRVFSCKGGATVDLYVKRSDYTTTISFDGN